MSRLEPDEDLRKRYAAMEDRLSVRLTYHQYFICEGSPGKLKLRCCADCPKEAQQANDPSREGNS